MRCEPHNSRQTMEVLPKDIIRTWILPHLSTGTCGCSCRVDLLEVVERLYSSSKWAINDYNYLLISFFSDEILAWLEVNYHFNEWRKDCS